MHRRPRRPDRLFEGDASFRLVSLAGEKVRFEASNYPGHFLTGREDGSVVLLKNPPAAQSTFVLKRE